MPLSALSGQTNPVAFQFVPPSTVFHTPMLGVSVASASPVARYMILGCCGSITRPLVPSRGKPSVRGNQLWPPSVLDQTPPLAEQRKSVWLSVGCIVTEFTRPMLGSGLGMFTGPSACQFEAIGAALPCAADDTSHRIETTN